MNEVTHVSAPTKLPIMAGGNVSAIVPKSIDEAFRLAEAFCVAGMIPDSYKGRDNRETASKVMIGIMKGAEVGLPPVTALSNIYIVNNRPSLWGDAALALVQHHEDFAGCVETIEGEPGTAECSATCTIKRRLDDGEVVTTRTFSWADAVRAKLTNKGPWVQYPQRMLAMRARAWCIRDSFADALSGLSIREEVEDMPAKPDEVATGFLDTGPETEAEPLEVNWPDTARMFSEAVSKIATQADMDAFVDLSANQRELMKAEAHDLWLMLEAEINAKSQSLAAPKK